jgi:hypothetical protein
MELSDAIELCRRQHANPQAVAAALDAVTGKEWRDWNARMLATTLKLGVDDVQQLDKVLACQVAVTNPDVFEDWHLFHHVGVAFNHRRANFNWLDELALHELAWACVCLRALQPQTSFDKEVLKYIAANCTAQGLLFFPWIGGEGLNLLDPSLGIAGMFDAALAPMVGRVKLMWSAGNLPEKTSEDDPFQVQLAHLRDAETYIRAQEKIA